MVYNDMYPSDIYVSRLQLKALYISARDRRSVSSCVKPVTQTR